MEGPKIREFTIIYLSSRLNEPDDDITKQYWYIS